MDDFPAGPIWETVDQAAFGSMCRPPRAMMRVVGSSRSACSQLSSLGGSNGDEKFSRRHPG
jgi:hypothetical protein